MTLQYRHEKQGTARIRAAFPGEHGAYSELALKKAIKRAETVACPHFADTFAAVAKGRVDCGLVPVENSTEGSVNQVYDLLLQHEVIALAEVFVNIHHMLIANPGTTIEDVKRVYSHPQALAQCREYLASRGLEAVQSYNTAGAVKTLKEKKLLDSAAIASEEAAEIYGMKILARKIEDKTDNCTRFLIIAKQEMEGRIREMLGRNGKYKTSLVFGLPHAPGALHTVLAEFAKSGANLTRIDSRPTKEKPWEYVFHVDFEGSTSDPAIGKMLERVQEKTAFLKVVGCYSVASE
ncbi:prephenate dehydratase [Candidatus Micrarchaeota archaeon]|nr:prephenate dehydratase [Candidatus Micrarchaeota archaeon]